MPKTNCLSVLTCIFPTFSQYIIFSISIQSRSFDKMLKFSIMPFSVSKVGSFLRIKQTQLYSIEEIKECWGCQDWKENYINNWYIHLKKKKEYFFCNNDYNSNGKSRASKKSIDSQQIENEIPIYNSCTIQLDWNKLLLLLLLLIKKITF